MNSRLLTVVFRVGWGLVVACQLFAHQAARAADFTLDPVIDGTQQMTGYLFPSFAYPTTAPTLQASFSQIASHVNITRYEDKFAMEFDLSTIPTGSVVTSATLFWTELTDILSPGNTHPLSGYTGDGLLSGTDFLGGTNLGQVANAVNNGRVAFDVTSFVAARVDAGDHYIGFSVINDGYYTKSTGLLSSITTVGTYQIASRLHSDPSARPQLVITVVPEASTLCLFGFGLLWVLVAATRTLGRRSGFPA